VGNKNMNNPLVSICCITYNHEEYIVEAIESFLKQKTNFNIEILIHDDASTDSTAEIVRIYEEKHPHIIKSVCQTENQYSKGVKYMNHTFNFQRAEGKYIAICEGDDYWIDPYKLQKQVDYMEEHEDCTFCFTNGKIVDATSKQRERLFLPYSQISAKYFDDISRTYTVGELALLDFIPTASFFFRKASIDKFPDFYYHNNFSAGDKTLSLLLTSQSYGYYINTVTCVYRSNVSGSTMTKWKTFNMDQSLKHNQGYLDFFEVMNQYTDYQYTKELDKAKLPYEFWNLLLQKDKRIVTNRRYRKHLHGQGLRYSVNVYTSLFFPNIYANLKRIIRPE